MVLVAGVGHPDAFGTNEVGRARIDALHLVARGRGDAVVDEEVGRHHAHAFGDPGAVGLGRVFLSLPDHRHKESQFELGPVADIVGGRGDAGKAGRYQVDIGQIAADGRSSVDCRRWSRPDAQPGSDGAGEAISERDVHRRIDEALQLVQVGQQRQHAHRRAAVQEGSGDGFDGRCQRRVETRWRWRFGRCCAGLDVGRQGLAAAVLPRPCLRAPGQVHAGLQADVDVHPERHHRLELGHADTIALPTAVHLQAERLRNRQSRVFVQADRVAAAEVAQHRSLFAEQAAAVEGAGDHRAIRQRLVAGDFGPVGAAELLEVERVHHEPRPTRRQRRPDAREHLGQRPNHLAGRHLRKDAQRLRQPQRIAAEAARCVGQIRGHHPGRDPAARIGGDAQIGHRRVADHFEEHPVLQAPAGVVGGEDLGLQGRQRHRGLRVVNPVAGRRSDLRQYLGEAANGAPEWHRVAVVDVDEGRDRGPVMEDPVPIDLAVPLHRHGEEDFDLGEPAQAR